MKKVFIYVLVVALIILLGITLMRNILKEEKETSSKNIVKEDVENTIENNEIENTIENNKIENTIENNKTTNATVEQKTEDIANTLENISDEEKVKRIVEKDWGEDNTVYFTIESKGNVDYEVCVRESATTKILYRYFVNISTGEFTKELEAF